MDFDKDTIIFFLPSMIKVPDKDEAGLLRFGFPRSNFPVQTRYEQTLRGLDSVRERMKGYNYRLVMMEASDIPQEWLDELRGKVDCLIHCYHDPTVHAATHSDCKSRGEVATIRKFLEWFTEAYGQKKFRTMIKFGIRYSLNENFSPETFLKDKFVFRKRDIPLGIRNAISQTDVNSVLYSFPYRLYGRFAKHMEMCFGWLQGTCFFDIENCLGHTLEDESTYCDLLGVTWESSIDGKVWHI